MQHWIFLAVAIISEVIATSFLKSAEDLPVFGRQWWLSWVICWLFIYYP